MRIKQIVMVNLLQRTYQSHIILTVCT